MRLPLTVTLKNRGSTTVKDGRMLNAYAENKGGVMRAVKRPSTVATFEAMEGGAGPGQGLFSYSTPSGTQTLVGIQNDVLYNSFTTIATRLAFTTQPVDWKVQTAISPAIVVKARDSFGAVITSYSGNVSLDFYDNPNGGSLSGTLTVQAVLGVATFSNVKIDKVGGGYSLQATATGLKFSKSNTFKIVSSLSFTGQPTSTAPNDPIVAQVTVVDSSGSAITGYTGDITISLAVNLVGATLSGTLTKTAVNGVANFTDLSINLDGTYILQATASAGSLSDVTSNSFDIGTFLVAGSAGAQRGYKRDAGLGSLTPNTLNGDTVIFLESKITATTNTAMWTLGVQPQSFFTSITIGGTTLTSAAATYVASGGSGNPGSTWTWTGTVLIPATGTYAVTFA